MDFLYFVNHLAVTIPQTTPQIDYQPHQVQVIPNLTPASVIWAPAITASTDAKPQTGFWRSLWEQIVDKIQTLQTIFNQTVNKTKVPSAIADSIAPTIESTESSDFPSSVGTIPSDDVEVEPQAVKMESVASANLVNISTFNTNNSDVTKISPVTIAKESAKPPRPIKISPDVKNLHLAAVEILNQEPTIDPKTFQPETGVRFNDDGSVTLRVLVGNPSDRLTVIGDFNQWGYDPQNYQLQPTADNPHIHQIILPPGNYHKAQYRLRDQNGRDRLHLSADLFATAAFNQRFYDYPRRADLNAVIWKPTAIDPDQVYPSPDLRGKQLVIAETDIVSLALKWTCQNPKSPYHGDTGAQHISELYRFVGECGLPEKLADMGYNTIEFMPLDTHVDFWEPKASYFPDWRYSYQIINFYGKHADFGSPDELRAMLNDFHKSKLAVTLDVVYSHFSHNGNNSPREFEPLGFTQYHGEDGQELYGQSWTRWGTRRFNYTPEIRKNIVDAALINILTYGFDGLRVDNVNGIQQQPYGHELVRELTESIKAYRPQAVVIGEGYFGDPYLNRTINAGGAGLLTTYSDRFYLWFTEDLMKYREEIDTWKLDYMLNKDWTRALLYYPGNHDEFANPGNPFQTRGRYLVEAIHGGDDHNRKIQSWAALNLFASSFYLDMPQLWTLQGGNLNDNSPIDWQQLQYPNINQLVQFQAAMKKFFTSEVAFAPYNLHSHMVRWIDHVNKVIVFERIDFTSDRHVYVVVNLGDQAFAHYKIGVAPETGTFELKVDSDRVAYGGADHNPSTLESQNHEVEIYLGSYGVVALAEPLRDDDYEPILTETAAEPSPNLMDAEYFQYRDFSKGWGY